MKQLIRSAIATCITLAILCTLTARNYVLFSPEDKPSKKLIEFINGAKKSIHAAIYYLTDKEIAASLINAKNRGVDVHIIMDVISTDVGFGKGDLLVQNGVPVYKFNITTNGRKQTDDQRFSYMPIMHNKFAIFDDALVWTGSFNWTVAANNKNCENVIYTDDLETCRRYKTHWLSLVTTRCSRYVRTALAQQNSPRWRSIKPLKQKRQTA